MKHRTSMVVALLIAISIISAFVLITNPDYHKETQTEFTETYPTHPIENIEFANSATNTLTSVPPTATLQPSGKITFVYNLTNVLPKEMFGFTYVKSEEISFNRNQDGSWETKQATPKMLDLGPLFQMYDYEPLITTTGDCGINTYPIEGYSPQKSFQPVCNFIQPKTVATITFGLENCDLDIYKNIVCKKETSSGQIYYKLSKNLDKFEFNYVGAWNYSEYPVWINQAVKALGFDPVPDNFYDNVQQGANHTISKNNK